MTETSLTFKVIKENVKMMRGYIHYLYIVADDGVYFTGWNYSRQASGLSSGFMSVPTKITLPTGYTVDDIIDIKLGSAFNMLVVKTSDDKRKIFVCGGIGSNEHKGNGTGESWTGSYKELTVASLESDEYLQDISIYGSSGAYIVTNKGNVYGWGILSLLGINSTNSSAYTLVPQKLNLSNIDNVSCGNGWIVCTGKDGKVYGTGSNIYGILGRWIGIDRNSPNSRYKTAFEWVECPELEI